MKAVFNQEKLLELCQWFNSLDNTLQINVIDWLTDKEDSISFSPEDSDNFESLNELISALIIELDGDMAGVGKVLGETGLDKIVIRALVEFCETIARPALDAKILSKMKKNNLKKTVSFVMNHFILYNDFQRLDVSEFLDLSGFKDAKSASRVLIFLRHHLEAVAKRQISVEGLTNLLFEFNLRKELVTEIVSPISDNLLNMSIALLFRDLDAINENMSELSDRLDSISKL